MGTMGIEWVLCRMGTMGVEWVYGYWEINIYQFTAYINYTSYISWYQFAETNIYSLE